MSRGTKLFLAILIPLILFSSGLARQAPNPPATPVTRPVLVNVFDLNGNAVRDLTKDDFRIRLNGKPAAVLRAEYSLAPRRIVVLLDMSGSMAGETDTKKWRIAREVLEDFLAQTAGDVPIAMLTFSGQVRDVFDFSQGSTAITNWLKQGPSQRTNIKIPARTALFDAILEGLKLLQPFQPGDAVYAITDGGENASHASTSYTKAILVKSGVRLFAFLFAEVMPPGGEQAGRDSFLEMVADSGGLAFGVSGRQRVGGASWEFEYGYDEHDREKVKLYTQELKIQVSGFWTLELVVPSSNKESKVKLEVVDRGGKTRKDVAFTYPRVLPAAK
jgi:hypothetical protein